MERPAGRPTGPGRHVSLPVLSGNSYDNTGSFSDVNWRHVKFIEQFSPDADRTEAAWLMMSDVCKHCVNAPCLEVCPTGAIVRTEFDTVYIQEPACNGCRDCVAACPFGVIHMSETRHVAQKCTFCYDRLKNGLPPACAQACPTQSIQFGPLAPAPARRPTHAARAAAPAGRDATPGSTGPTSEVLGGLNAFYLLRGRAGGLRPAVATRRCRAERAAVRRSGASSPGLLVAPGRAVPVPRADAGTGPAETPAAEVPA